LDIGRQQTPHEVHSLLDQVPAGGRRLAERHGAAAELEVVGLADDLRFAPPSEHQGSPVIAPRYGMIACSLLSQE
jgi:hypothetical protein